MTFIARSFDFRYLYMIISECVVLKEMAISLHHYGTFFFHISSLPPLCVFFLVSSCACMFVFSCIEIFLILFLVLFFLFLIFMAFLFLNDCQQHLISLHQFSVSCTTSLLYTRLVWFELESLIMHCLYNLYLQLSTW